MYKFQDLENFGEYLYKDRLPLHYQLEDSDQNYALKKYMSAAGIGYTTTSTDIVKSLELFDPEKCPEKFFPILFSNFGLPYFQDLPMKLQRKLLANIGELYLRKGTKNVVKYLGREVTGLDVTIVERFMNDYAEADIILSATDSWEDISGLGENINWTTFERFIGYFLPFDIDYYFMRVLKNTEHYNRQYVRETVGIQFDRFVYVSDSVITNSRLYRTNSTFITNKYTSSSYEVYTNNIREDEWEDNESEVESEEIYNLKRRLEESKTNTIIHRTNRTLITNLQNSWDIEL